MTADHSRSGDAQRTNHSSASYFRSIYGDMRLFNCPELMRLIRQHGHGAFQLVEMRGNG